MAKKSTASSTKSGRMVVSGGVKQVQPTPHVVCASCETNELVPVVKTEFVGKFSGKFYVCAKGHIQPRGTTIKQVYPEVVVKKGR